jgi:hypothetical protein
MEAARHVTHPQGIPGQARTDERKCDRHPGICAANIIVIPEFAQQISGTSQLFAERLFRNSLDITATFGGPGLRRDDGACFMKALVTNNGANRHVSTHS